MFTMNDSLRSSAITQPISIDTPVKEKEMSTNRVSAPIDSGNRRK